MDTSNSARGRNRGWWLLAGAILAFILIPFALLAGPLESWAGSLMEWRPAPWIAATAVVALLASDIVLPIPSSVVLVYSGVVLGPWWGTVASAVGLTLSLVFGHLLGRLAGRGVIRRLLDEGQRAQLEAAFARWGVAVVSATRPVPVLAEAAAFLSGLARWSPAAVLGWGSLANLGVALVMAGAGAWSRELNQPALAWAAAMGLPGLAWVLFRALSPRTR